VLETAEADSDEARLHEKNGARSMPRASSGEPVEVPKDEMGDAGTR
jgi:hypothetical protein